VLIFGLLANNLLVKINKDVKIVVKFFIHVAVLVLPPVATLIQYVQNNVFQDVNVLLDKF